MQFHPVRSGVIAALFAAAPAMAKEPAKATPLIEVAVAKVPVAAQYRANLSDKDDSIERGAAFLTATQGIFPSGSNANAIVLDGWEWESGSGKGAGNISGVVGVGLIEAFEATGDTGLLQAATARAEVAAKLIENGERPFAPDVEALARVGRHLGRSEWISLAKMSVKARISASGSVADEVARMKKSRAGMTELTGYEVALLADAAIAAGLDDEAKALVREVVGSIDGWLKDARSPYALVSSGALLATCSRLGLAPEARLLAVPLLAAQLDDGSWRVRETQPTAYATRGLALFGRTFSDAMATRAAAKGRGWLRLTQLKNGAWAEFNDYLPEPFVGTVFAPATAEALRAVVAAR